MSLRLPLVSVAMVLAVPVASATELGATVKLTLRLPSVDETGTPGQILTETDLGRFFNSARCECARQRPAESTYRIEYTWDGAAATTSQPLIPWSGVGCNGMPTTRDEQCTRHSSFEAAEIVTLKKVDYPIFALVAAPGAMECPTDARVVNHWLVTQNGDTWDANSQFKLDKDITADMKAPPLPAKLTLEPLEGGIVLSWDALPDATDVQYFQALCSKEDGSKAHDAATDTAKFQRPSDLCGAPNNYVVPNGVVTNPGTGTPADVPAALMDLDPAFICGEASGSARSITLKGLENGTPYRVVLASIDKSRNLSAVAIDRAISPQQVTDFWEELTAEDGQLEGGFCVSQVGRRGDVGGALAIAAAALIAARRRRRRSRRLAKVVALSLVLAPALASAQASYSPYWQDDEPADLGLPETRWTLGLRLGPYVPSIDRHFSSNPGPYARTFLNDSVMFAVDVHRVWSLARGQLGVGLTAGYYSNSALAWEDGSSSSDPMRPRASGNLTRLSIAPTALTAIYRATIFDDEYGVPLVPYARGGIAYDIWWMKNPADELSSSMTGGRALGATIGLVAAVGVAIRAERIDPDAAASMASSGLTHAGFFAELEAGWVDGFGNDHKLSVGDTTWFGGISFEF